MFGMKSLFDTTGQEDESDPSIGEEIGRKLSEAIIEIGKSNKDYTSSILNMAGSVQGIASGLPAAIKSALDAVEPRNIVIEEKNQPTEWEFTVIRDNRGLIQKVIKRAIY